MRFSTRELVIIVLGVLLAIKIHLMGVLVAGELLGAMICMYQLAVFPRLRWTYHSVFLMFAVLALIGYFISDAYQASDRANMLKGLARWCFLITNIQSIHFLCQNQIRYLNLLIISYAFGFLINAMMSYGVTIDSHGHYWKFGYSTPITLILLYLSDRSSALLASLKLAGLSMINLLLDFRTVVLLAFVLFLKRFALNSVKLAIISGLSVALMAVFLFPVVYGMWLSSNGAMADRQMESNIKRLSMLHVATLAISESPIIGHGTWPYNPQIVREGDQFCLERGVYFYHKEEFEGIIVSHSQVLQAWIEGGVLTLPFFFLLIHQIFFAIITILRRIEFKRVSLFLYMLLDQFIDTFFNPMGTYERASIAIVFCIATVIRTSSVKHTPKVKTVDKFRSQTLRIAHPTQFQKKAG